jgi:translation initiation factor 3 subunit C
MVKEEPYAPEVQKFRADPDEFMKEVVIQDKPSTKSRPKKVTFTGYAEDEQADDQGFETVGRDGKALAYTPESILKSNICNSSFNHIIRC